MAEVAAAWAVPRRHEPLPQPRRKNPTMPRWKPPLRPPPQVRKKTFRFEVKNASNRKQLRKQRKDKASDLCFLCYLLFKFLTQVDHGKTTQSGSQGQAWRHAARPHRRRSPSG